MPFGVVGAIYEARPNVTVDIAALALRSRQRRGAARRHRRGVDQRGARPRHARRPRPRRADPDAIQTVDDFGRDGANALMRARGLVDVLVPRGSAALIQTVVTKSAVPVIETGEGNVHILLDESAPWNGRATSS